MCRRYALGLAVAAGLAVIGVVAIAMSGESQEPTTLAVSSISPLIFFLFRVDVRKCVLDGFRRFWGSCRLCGRIIMGVAGARL